MSGDYMLTSMNAIYSLKLRKKNSMYHPLLLFQSSHGVFRDCPKWKNFYGIIKGTQFFFLFKMSNFPLLGTAIGYTGMTYIFSYI